MIRAVAGISLVFLATGGAFGQSDAPAPAFEVASVKVSAPLPPGVMMFNMGGAPIDPGRIDYKGINLRSLIARAYGVKDFQVEGPQWLEDSRYDIVATIPKGSNTEQINLMMQGLLKERFKLALHRESKPLAVYTLSVAKGGPKLKAVDAASLAAASPPLPPGALPPPPPPPGTGGPGGRGMGLGIRMMIGPNNRRMNGNATMKRLCDMLSNLTDRPVVDLTELTGTYEIDLSWTPDENENMGGRMAGLRVGLPPPPPPAGGNIQPDGASDPGLSLAQTLQTNYGLKLEAKKNPADILVIDRAEKVPTEN
jgi:uncharacterized protein (TIGR03435 family)